MKSAIPSVLLMSSCVKNCSQLKNSGTLDVIKRVQQHVLRFFVGEKARF